MAKLGIIPAHAGNTQGIRRNCNASKDHPRACGEHYIGHIDTFMEQGSSPRMRGTPCFFCFSACRFGIIPAHAGNTGVTCSPTPWSWDHPRACGEHSEKSNQSSLLMGSSPRMRGTQIQERCGARCVGIIPAHAGNTSCSWRCLRSYWDHPRACGEHLKLGQGAKVGRGSSPRMRGTHEIPALGRRDPGIIPAHAGNTLNAAKIVVTTRDHPRACGEHQLTTGGDVQKAGSSPRMRGTLYGRYSLPTASGIIPAHAGNTTNRQNC